MIKYPHDEFTRVAVLPSINDLALPTIAEIAAGVDITCDLTADGLKLPRVDETVDATPWRGPLAVERSTYLSMSGSQLTGFRFRNGDEPLWDLSIYKTRAFLLVRRGVRVEVPWTVNDVVETLDFRFRKRSTSDTGTDTLVTFTVGLNVTGENDDARVAA